jgi:hypothetical protein
MERHIATIECASDDSSQRPECDPITGSFVKRQRPVKKSCRGDKQEGYCGLAGVRRE